MFFILMVIDEIERKECGLLITRLAKGDESALNLIYQNLGSRLFSVALGILRRKEAAEDALQEAFIRIVQHANTFRNGTNGYAWLCTVVRNTSLNILKKERVSQCADIDACAHLIAGVSFSGDAENAIMAEKALAGLMPLEKKAVWLKYYNDMTVRDIAFELDLPKSTAGDIITRAETKMRKIIEGTE